MTDILLIATFVGLILLLIYEGFGLFIGMWHHRIDYGTWFGYGGR